jgi:hypothetical protein
MSRTGGSLASVEITGTGNPGAADGDEDTAGHGPLFSRQQGAFAAAAPPPYRRATSVTGAPALVVAAEFDGAS